MAFGLQLVGKCRLEESERDALELTELVDWANRMGRRGWWVRVNGFYDPADARLCRAFPERWAPDSDA